MTPEPQTEGVQFGPESGVNKSEPSVMTDQTPRSESTTTPPWEEDQAHPLTQQGDPGIAPPTKDISAAADQPQATEPHAVVTASEPVNPEPVVPKKPPERQDAEAHDKETPKEAAPPAKAAPALMEKQRASKSDQTPRLANTMTSAHLRRRLAQLRSCPD